MTIETEILPIRESVLGGGALELGPSPDSRIRIFLVSATKQDRVIINDHETSTCRSRLKIRQVADITVM